MKLPGTHALRKITDAMGCQLTYAFVPDKPIKEVLDEQAKTKVRELLNDPSVSKWHRATWSNPHRANLFLP